VCKSHWLVPRIDRMADVTRISRVCWDAYIRSTSSEEIRP
jgi:hypothetical protein